jgi:hypothetical protein
MVFKQPEQVDWQLRWLLAQGAAVVLHIDRKALPAFGPLLARWRVEPLLHPVPDPVVVNWAGFSQVEATLRCLRTALDREPGFRHLHLMSGECVPLRPMAEIAQAVDRLSAAGVSDLIESRAWPAMNLRINRFNILGESPRNREPAFNAAFVRLRKLQFRLGLPERKNFRPEEILFGGQWWTAHRATVERMLQGPAMDDFVRRFRWTRCADEHFFQMLRHRLGLRAVGSHRFCEVPPGLASLRYMALPDLHRLRDEGYLFARKVAPQVARSYWPDPAPCAPASASPAAAGVPTTTNCM